MKCDKCNGTGKLDTVITIPLWHNEEGVATIKFVAYDENATNSQEAREMATAFYRLLRAHGHGVFHDTLSSLFRDR